MTRKRLLRVAIPIGLVLLGAAWWWLRVVSIMPPLQPASGPGGGEYLYEKIRITHRNGGNSEYWIFEPEKTKEKLPVIIFVHGWSATNPLIYSAWLAHLVRRGNIVIFPEWQNGSSTKTATDQAIKATRHAMNELTESAPESKYFDRLTNAANITGDTITASMANLRDNPAMLNRLRELRQMADHALPDLDRIAVIGHSAGGLIAANMATRLECGLPRIRALLISAPGKTWEPPRDTIGEPPIALDDLSRIPAGTLMLVIAADADSVAGEIDGRRILAETTAINPEDKNYILLHSDHHGWPPLVAGHNTASGVGMEWQGLAIVQNSGIRSTVDALDYYGYWKWFDALTDAAFYGKNREFALGNTEEQRNMGTWADGTPVKTPDIFLTLPPEEKHKND